ncbi:transglutaminase-like cysteine peptidase [Pseudovibrio sp. Tun.PSC04-5.I4]|uniref:transglutaminase-like cysteine peptidase n=1 Tax=Pseudovibrio sp. Tun.PSC04-5.I4 TaxID=1798213 RepID=UPI001AD8DD8A|nr:transglutaminase-like cysteine peptidase [Pseudovibrio sp. Tun.PSC04-5.I4]
MSKGQAHNLQFVPLKKIRKRQRFSSANGSSRGSEIQFNALGLFGSVEMPGGRSRAYQKWRAVLPQCDKQLLYLQQCMAGSVRSVGPVDYWARIIRGVGGTKSVRQLSLLNSYINESAGYDRDAITAGVADIWRAPLQFLGFKGDCEDYAIAKYYSLLALGYAEENLRFIVVKDSSRDIIHAVTSVKLQHQRYVLDSLRPVATKEIALLHYHPLVSMTRDAHFTHLVTEETRQQFIAQHKKG